MSSEAISRSAWRRDGLPASPMASELGIADRVWSLGDLIDVAPAVATPDPTETAPDRRFTPELGVAGLLPDLRHRPLPAGRQGGARGTTLPGGTQLLKSNDNSGEV